MNATRLRQFLPDIAFYTACISIPVAVFIFFQAHKQDVQLFFLDEYTREQMLANFATTITDFLTLTLGILVEAIPFVILGVLISVVIQVVLPTNTLIKRLPKNIVARRAIISCLGILMPVCECGNVPVARSLIAKGFSVQEAIVFLLAAPSVNFITFIVTWEAFSFNHSVAIARVVATLIVANATAFIVAKYMGWQPILTAEFSATCKSNNHAPRTLRHATGLFRTEMWLVLRLLVIGAMIAAASQAFVPREAITAIGSSMFMSVVAMIVLAFVISICSSVDAFFALAYVSTFSLGSILAFLVAGPMVDIKMIALLKTTFTYRALSLITASVGILTLCIGIICSYVW